MKQLLWKELHEKRLWGLLLVLCSLAVTVFAGGYSVVGSISSFTVWSWLPITLSFLLGASSYAWELSGTADFIHSRAVTWKRILLAKVSTSLFLIVLSALAGVAAYRLLRPEQYAEFTTFPYLLLGVGRAVLLLGSSYLIGLTCSILWPGAFAGVLVLLGMLGGSSLHLKLHHLITGSLPHTTFWTLGWLVGMLMGFIFVARCGLTLRWENRFNRYAAAVISIVFLFSVVGTFVPEQSNPFNLDFSASSISPDGQYAISGVMSFADAEFRETLFLVRLSDRRTALVEESLSPDLMLTPHWASPNTPYYYANGTLKVLRMEPDGRLVEKSLPVEAGEYARVIPSPDGTLAMLIRRDKLFIADIKGARILDLVIPEAKRRWWHSNTEIAYIDPEGNRHIVDLSRLE